MEKVIYSKNGGCGVILQTNEREDDCFKAKSFIICGIEIKPNDMTDLFGLFTSRVRYVGVLNDYDNCMCFYLGDGSEDLFGMPSYYSCFFYISEKRLANKYSHNSARDLNFIDGRWK